LRVWGWLLWGLGSLMAGLGNTGFCGLGHKQDFLFNFVKSVDWQPWWQINHGSYMQAVQKYCFNSFFTLIHIFPKIYGWCPNTLGVVNYAHFGCVMDTKLLPCAS
jgi:hypothetical protein